MNTYIEKKSSVKVDLTDITDEIDAEKFIKAYWDNAQKELDELLEKVIDSADKEELKTASTQLIDLYQRIYVVCESDEKESIQRSMNLCKSIIASISARHKLDYVNKIIEICKKSAIIALGLAVKFIAV